MFANIVYPYFLIFQNSLKMKKVSACLILLFILSSSFVFAQIEVQTTGNVLLGNPWSGNDNSTSATIQCFGINTTSYRPGSRISFGDYRAPSSYNVYLGEYGNTDTDGLELHGASGIHFTTGTATIYEIGSLSSSGNFSITGSFYANSTLSYSDERLKKNIKPFGTGLSYIKQLSAITFNYKTDKEEATLASLNATKLPSEKKELDNFQKTKQILTDKINNPDLVVGFSAQAVQKVLPNLVKTDDNGFLALNYTALIPILVEALKDQQTLIEFLRADVDALKKK